jgi:hypothetical protein
MPDLKLLWTPESESGGRVWTAETPNGYDGTVLLRLSETFGGWAYSVTVRYRRGECFVHATGKASQKYYACKAALAVARELVHQEVLNA